LGKELVFLFLVHTHRKTLGWVEVVLDQVVLVEPVCKTW